MVLKGGQEVVVMGVRKERVGRRGDGLGKGLGGGEGVGSERVG